MTETKSEATKPLSLHDSVMLFAVIVGLFILLDAPNAEWPLYHRATYFGGMFLGIGFGLLLSKRLPKNNENA